MSFEAKLRLKTKIDRANFGRENERNVTYNVTVKSFGPVLNYKNGRIKSGWTRLFFDPLADDVNGGRGDLEIRVPRQAVKVLSKAVAPRSRFEGRELDFSPSQHESIRTQWKKRCKEVKELDEFDRIHKPQKDLEFVLAILESQP